MPYTHPEHGGFARDCAEVVIALLTSSEPDGDLSATVRAAIARCARNAREGNCPPEALLVGVKEALRNTSIPGYSPTARRALEDLVITEMIGAYYAE